MQKRLTHLKPLAHKLAVPAQLALAALILVLAGISLHHMACGWTSTRCCAMPRPAGLAAGGGAGLHRRQLPAADDLRRDGPARDRQAAAWRAAALASFTSYTLSHNLGFGIITGAAARLRVYGARGLSTGDVARVTAIAGVTFWTGVLASAALALLVHQRPLVVPGVLPLAMQHTVGAALLVLLAVATLLGKRWHLPGPGGMARMTTVALADIAAACAALSCCCRTLPPRYRRCCWPMCWPSSSRW
jgi:phosphatidylglycerol lysyltransferase